MEAHEFLLGRSWGQRVVIIGTAVLYLYLGVANPAAAIESARQGLATLVRLFTLILASLLLASALEALLPEEAVMRYLGGGGGPANTVLAGLLGGVLMGGPYATYPIMRSVRRSGASYGALVAMYVGYSAIGVGRIPFGLVIFSPTVVALRLVFAVGLTVVAALAIWAFLPDRELSVDESTGD
ncbi:MAG: permease [Halodesulfurarchaeum sp.]